MRRVLGFFFFVFSWKSWVRTSHFLVLFLSKQCCLVKLISFASLFTQYRSTSFTSITKPIDVKLLSFQMNLNKIPIIFAVQEEYWIIEFFTLYTFRLCVLLYVIVILGPYGWYLLDVRSSSFKCSPTLLCGTTRWNKRLCGAGTNKNNDYFEIKQEKLFVLSEIIFQIIKSPYFSTYLPSPLTVYKFHFKRKNIILLRQRENKIALTFFYKDSVSFGSNFDTR